MGVATAHSAAQLGQLQDPTSDGSPGGSRAARAPRPTPRATARRRRRQDWHSRRGVVASQKQHLRRGVFAPQKRRRRARRCLSRALRFRHGRSFAANPPCPGRAHPLKSRRPRRPTCPLAVRLLISQSIPGGAAAWRRQLRIKQSGLVVRSGRARFLLFLLFSHEAGEAEPGATLAPSRLDVGEAARGGAVLSVRVCLLTERRIFHPPLCVFPPSSSIRVTGSPLLAAPALKLAARAAAARTRLGTAAAAH
jgi:hypothetical protein